jgi:hypothetical protein
MRARSTAILVSTTGASVGAVAAANLFLSGASRSGEAFAGTPPRTASALALVGAVE